MDGSRRRRQLLFALAVVAAVLALASGSFRLTSVTPAEPVDPAAIETRPPDRSTLTPVDGLTMKDLLNRTATPPKTPPQTVGNLSIDDLFNGTATATAAGTGTGTTPTTATAAATSATATATAAPTTDTMATPAGGMASVGAVSRTVVGGWAAQRPASAGGVVAARRPAVG